jgi:hypothetical protein
MNTWKDKNPEFEYILWNEERIDSELSLMCQREIEMIEEINGKADIIRWEILFKYGGIFIDADSICVEPIITFYNYNLQGVSAFATFENEALREGLIATGTMGFTPNHVLCKDIIDWVQTDDGHRFIGEYKAWYSVGPALLTRMLNTGKYIDFAVFPSFTFLPIHFTDDESKNAYIGHKRVYGYQLWGTAKNSYDTINSTVELPLILKTPDEWVSILVSSFNTQPHYMEECLKSIANQHGHFGIELVWINDGSTPENTAMLKQLLKTFQDTSRWLNIHYSENSENMGTRVSLRRGIEMCSNEFIFKMDSDDIMLPNRLHVQLDFMKNTPECQMCGSNMVIFRCKDNGKKYYITQTTHPPIVEFRDILDNQWFANHPTLCYRKSAVLQVGNYELNDKKPSMMEDYGLEVKFLKTFGKIWNIQESLLHYRIHPEQLTYCHREK